jgi:hypothetical protein
MPSSNEFPDVVNDVMGGPFRVADLTFNLPTNFEGGNEASNASSWQPRDTFAYWQDGTSNQLIIGEKFIPQEVIDIATPTAAEAEWDGSLISARTNNGVPNFARFVHPNLPCLKRSPQDYPPNADPRLGVGAIDGWNHAVFGGIHPGVANFAIGDGSVRAIATTIDFETLYFLVNVNDGRAVSIP